MKENIKREDLKSNFLKNTIIRLDYDYLFEENIEQIVKNLNEFLIKKNYRMNSRTLNQFSVGFDMKKLDEDESPVDFNKKPREEFASFINKDGNIIVDITRNFATMTVNYKENKKFEDIIEIFNEVKKQVENVREGIGLNRIGIRKTNIYYLRNIENINRYFEERLFSFNTLISNKDVIIKQQLESYSIDGFKVNQNSEVQIGTYTEKEKPEKEKVYRIVLDIDIYDDVLENNKIDLYGMNSIVFEIYKSNLKEEFLEQLKEENYENKELFKL